MQNSLTQTVGVTRSSIDAEERLVSCTKRARKRRSEGVGDVRKIYLTVGAALWARRRCGIWVGRQGCEMGQLDGCWAKNERMFSNWEIWHGNENSQGRAGGL